MFATAKPINETTKKSKAKSKAEYAVTCFENLTRVKTAVKAIEGLVSSLDAQVKEHGFNIFVAIGRRSGFRPENFRGVEGKAKGSIELRSRGDRSALTDDELAVLTEAAIPTSKVTAVNKMFGINPKYTEDTALLGKIEAALKGIVPEDLIVIQEERSMNVVSEETISAAFQNLQKKSDAFEASKSPADKMAFDQAVNIVKMITTMATKPTTSETLAEVMKNVQAMLLPKDEEEETK